jgi:hypothetical protein
MGLFPIIFFSSCLYHAEPEIHLIPKNYKGPVIIIFNEKKGNPQKYENDIRVYEISKDGILRTQFKKQQGSIAPDKLKYFFYDKNGRQEINYLVSTKDITDSATYVFNKELSNTTVRYLVGKLSEGDGYYKALRKRIDELFPPEVQ